MCEKERLCLQVCVGDRATAFIIRFLRTLHSERDDAVA